MVSIISPFLYLICYDVLTMNIYHRMINPCFDQICIYDMLAFDKYNEWSYKYTLNVCRDNTWNEHVRVSVQVTGFFIHETLDSKSDAEWFKKPKCHLIILKIKYKFILLKETWI